MCMWATKASAAHITNNYYQHWTIKCDISLSEPEPRLHFHNIYRAPVCSLLWSLYLWMRIKGQHDITRGQVFIKVSDKTGHLIVYVWALGLLHNSRTRGLLHSWQIIFCCTQWFNDCSPLQGWPTTPRDRAKSYNASSPNDSDDHTYLWGSLALTMIWTHSLLLNALSIHDFCACRREQRRACKLFNRQMREWWARQPSEQKQTWFSKRSPPLTTSARSSFRCWF